mgnify:CR=1 FL=1
MKLEVVRFAQRRAKAALTRVTPHGVLASRTITYWRVTERSLPLWARR